MIPTSALLAWLSAARDFLLLCGAFGLPVLACWQGIQLIWPEKVAFRGRVLLQLCLAWGGGIGLVSCGYFLWRCWIDRPDFAFVLTESTFLTLLTGTLYLARRPRVRSVAPPPCRRLNARRDYWLQAFLLAGFGAALASVLWNFWIASLHDPHGGWDALATWNARARFLYRAGADWKRTFNYPTSHPDYPLLLPASIARAWTYLRRESTLVPALAAVLFGLGTVGVLVLALGLLRSTSQGLIAGIVLLGTQGFLRELPNQIADIPLSFFMLSTVALICIHDFFGVPDARLVVLAGILAGLAAWTKNEGWLFIVVLLMARLGLALSPSERHRHLCEWGTLLLALLPVLSVVVWFKLGIAPENDLVSRQGWHATVGRICSGHRWKYIGTGYWYFMSMIGPGMVYLLAVYYLLVGSRPMGSRSAGVTFPAWIIVLMLSGYFLVYLTTPRQVREHLPTSLERLLLQLWPLTLFGFFLKVATPEELALKRASRSAKIPPLAGDADSTVPRR